MKSTQLENPTIAAAAPLLLPLDLDLRTVSRWPTTLTAATETAINNLSIPWSEGRLPDSWHRPAAVDGGHRLEADATMSPAASIIVLAHNNLVFTRLCLESLLPHTTEIDFELIVVDNSSTDGTREYLQSLAEASIQVHLILNERNVGFAAACNQGLALARGENLVLLNNDTILPPGWLAQLLAWLKDDKIGLIGPVTNRSGNESQISTTYTTLAEFLEFSADYTASHTRQSFDIRVVTMFCAALRRNVYEKVGPLDEQFELALFEDDDYSMRVRNAGWAVRCAEDVCIHHFGQASVGKLEDRYGPLFHANRRRWEAKWNVGWQPHSLRPNRNYQDLTARIAEIASRLIPSGRPTLVVSKGDDALLAAIGPHARHFPQNPTGDYAGFNPADSQSAIDHFDELHAAGAKFLLIPATSIWWLDHYDRFANHLRCRFQVIHDRMDECLIFSLVLTRME